MNYLKELFLVEKNVLIAILINAIVICLLYFPEYEDNFYLTFIDHIFIVFFLIEAIVKIYTFKPSAYFASNWNRFDFFIVVVSLPSLLVNIMPLPDTSLFLILRLFRLARLVRFIHFVPNLTKIILGLGRAIKASVFVLLALLFFNFLLSIFTCHFYAKVAPEYFGNPLISSYSIFQMFTVEGWNEIPATIAKKMMIKNDEKVFEEAGIEQGSELIIEELPPSVQEELKRTRRRAGLMIGLTRFYFVLVVLVGGIFGMSLANAVFVDEMTMDNNDLLEQKIDSLQGEIAEIKELLKRKP
jgi:voltage-gated sodium channel